MVDRVGPPLLGSVWDGSGTAPGRGGQKRTGDGVKSTPPPLRADKNGQGDYWRGERGEAAVATDAGGKTASGGVPTIRLARLHWPAPYIAEKRR